MGGRAIKRNPNTERMRAWLPIIRKFELDYTLVLHHREKYPLEFAEQIERCADDDARVLILGLSR